MAKLSIVGLHCDGDDVVLHLADGTETRRALASIAIERDDHGAAIATIDGERYGDALASALAAAKG